MIYSFVLSQKPFWHLTYIKVYENLLTNASTFITPCGRLQIFLKYKYLSHWRP